MITVRTTHTVYTVLRHFHLQRRIRQSRSRKSLALVNQWVSQLPAIVREIMKKRRTDCETRKILREYLSSMSFSFSSNRKWRISMNTYRERRYLRPITLSSVYPTYCFHIKKVLVFNLNNSSYFFHLCYYDKPLFLRTLANCYRLIISHFIRYDI